MSKTGKCIICGYNNPESALYCEGCGAKLGEKELQIVKKKRMKLIIATAIIAIALGNLVGYGIGYGVYTPQIQELKAMVAFIWGKLEDANQTIAALNSTKIRLENKVSTLEREKATLTNRVSELESKVNNLNSQVRTLTSQRNYYEDKWNASFKTITDLNSTISDLRRQVDSLKSDVAYWKKKYESVKPPPPPPPPPPDWNLIKSVSGSDNVVTGYFTISKTELKITWTRDAEGIFGFALKKGGSYVHSHWFAAQSGEDYVHGVEPGSDYYLDIVAYKSFNIEVYEK